MVVLIYNVRMGFDSSIQYRGIDVSLTMLVWMDVLDSDRGNFRRQRADLVLCRC